MSEFTPKYEYQPPATLMVGGTSGGQYDGPTPADASATVNVRIVDCERTPEPLPASVQVGPFAYSTELARLSRWMGEIDYERQSIRVSDDCKLDQARDSLLHEVLHACLQVAGLHREEWVERAVGGISPTLLDTLRRNPALVAYLLDGAA